MASPNLGAAPEHRHSRRVLRLAELPQSGVRWICLKNCTEPAGKLPPMKFVRYGEPPRDEATVVGQRIEHRYFCTCPDEAPRRGRFRHTVRAVLDLADDILELRLQGDPGSPPMYFFAIHLRGTTTSLGHILLRLDPDDRGLVDFAGHIGFEIAPEHRGHGHALRATRLLGPLARRRGFSELWLMTSPDNMACRRTLERLGARYIDTAPIPLGSDMRALGIDRVRRYRWTLPP